jgi:RNA polymerase sigma-70 factor, ECF subfamily
MRTEVKTRVAELCEKLPPDDQTLVLLRISRQLDWKEIARVMPDEKGEATDRALDKEAARFRQRFQVIKEKLRKMAAERASERRTARTREVRGSDDKQPGT